MKQIERVKEVRCNKCGEYFTSKRADDSRIRCPACHSNESLSIRLEEPRLVSIPVKSIDELIPKPIQKYLEELAAQHGDKQTDTAT
ncbi:zinc ribbon domain-containing protein [bacterium]|nr:zinc ribbon domain-containing protein [bacterium]